MADFDFLDGFDTGGDWGFTGVSEKPSDKAVSDSKATEQVVKQTSESVGKAVSGEIITRLESKLDKILRATNEAKETITAKNETELEIAKKQMDDEYDLRKDNLGKDMKTKFAIGCLVQWYECDIIEEYVNSLNDNCFFSFDISQANIIPNNTASPWFIFLEKFFAPSNP